MFHTCIARIVFDFLSKCWVKTHKEDQIGMLVKLNLCHITNFNTCIFLFPFYEQFFFMFLHVFCALLLVFHILVHVQVSINSICYTKCDICSNTSLTFLPVYNLHQENMSVQ